MTNTGPASTKRASPVTAAAAGKKKARTAEPPPARVTSTLLHELALLADAPKLGKDIMGPLRGLWNEVVAEIAGNAVQFMKLSGRKSVNKKDIINAVHASGSRLYVA